MSGAMLYAAPADTITLGVIGAGGRGTLVMTTFQKSPGVRVVGVCDVYERNLERGISKAAKAQSGGPKSLPQITSSCWRTRASALC